MWPLYIILRPCFLKILSCYLKIIFCSSKNNMETQRKSRSLRTSDKFWMINITKQYFIVNRNKQRNCHRLYVTFNPCHAEWIKMPRPLLNFSQSDYLIKIFDINSYTEWQTVKIHISWLLQKPTDLDLYYLQRQSISGFSMTRVDIAKMRLKVVAKMRLKVVPLTYGFIVLT